MVSSLSQWWLVGSLENSLTVDVVDFDPVLLDDRAEEIWLVVCDLEGGEIV